MSNRENLIMPRINMALLTECGAMLPPQTINIAPLTGVQQLAPFSRVEASCDLASVFSETDLLLGQPRQDRFLICQDSFLIIHHAIQLCLVFENCSLVRYDSFLIEQHTI